MSFNKWHPANLVILDSGILSLADDVVSSENPFSELEDHHQPTNGNMTDSLNDIGFEWM